MPSKMQLERLNTTQGGNIMKCIFCGETFKPLEKGQKVCEDCVNSVDELTNGKGDDNDE